MISNRISTSRAFFASIPTPTGQPDSNPPGRGRRRRGSSRATPSCGSASTCDCGSKIYGRCDFLQPVPLQRRAVSRAVWPGHPPATSRARWACWTGQTSAENRARTDFPRRAVPAGGGRLAWAPAGLPGYQRQWRVPCRSHGESIKATLDSYRGQDQPPQEVSPCQEQ